MTEQEFESVLSKVKDLESYRKIILNMSLSKLHEYHPTWKNHLLFVTVLKGIFSEMEIDFDDFVKSNYIIRLEASELAAYAKTPIRSLQEFKENVTETDQAPNKMSIEFLSTAQIFTNLGGASVEQPSSSVLSQANSQKMTLNVIHNHLHAILADLTSYPQFKPLNFGSSEFNLAQVTNSQVNDLAQAILRRMGCQVKGEQLRALAIKLNGTLGSRNMTLRHMMGFKDEAAFKKECQGRHVKPDKELDLDITPEVESSSSLS